MTATYTVGELFAGVGGFGMGFEQQGFRIVWQAEWDKNCQSVLRRHWPDCTLYGDVTDVNGSEIAPVDVITFGSPCQDLSVAGKRAGLDGDRSSMFFQAIRIIKEMRDATNGVFPRIAVWENVPGALTSNKGDDFGVVLDSLADIGAMAIEWAVLDAQHFGVPQRRRRVFVVAIFDPATANRCPDPLLPVSEGRRGDFAKGNKKGQELAETIGSGSGSRGLSSDTEMPFPIQGTIIGRSDTAGPQGTGVGEPDGVMYTLDRVSQHGVAQPIIFENSFRDGIRINDDISHTLPAKIRTGGGDQQHVAQHDETSLVVRRLTPLETERLMGWPDDHTRWTNDGREQADNHRYRQCGNGVATPVAAWIAKQIHQLFECKQLKDDGESNG